MSKNKSNNIKNNYQHFKATIGTISEELDYFGNFKEVLSLDKVYLKTRGDNLLPIMLLSTETKLQRLYLS
jgi:hypothetical protein